MKKVLVFIICLAFSFGLRAKDYEVKSPDENLSIIIKVDKKEGVFFTAAANSIHLMDMGPLSMDIQNYGDIAASPKVRKVFSAKVEEDIFPVVKEKRALIKNNYNQITLLFKSNFGLIIRAYNDGWAYRLSTELGDQVQINSEDIVWNFPENPMIYYPTEESFFTHSEREYEHLGIGEIPADKFASLPALVDRADGIKILLTESNLEDYPGLYLIGTGQGIASLRSTFPSFVLEEKLYRDRDIKPVKRADYLAITSGTRMFPWRVAAISRNDKDLVSNDLVLRLAPASRIDNTDWIKPGMVAWDWWNATNNAGLPFRSGVNTATYKYHIDFAAEYGLEYVILDEGWSVPGDLFKLNPECDMDEITRYAKEKGVGVILWVLWNALDNDLERALDKFVDWGVKGIKVDFMQRDDQAMVNYYWKIAREAAERELLVDFHGSYKPSGLRGAYPNCVSREGLKGLENAKWSSLITPDHDCTLPFIRMVAGPMDYTPGAMRNAQKINYNVSFTRPMSMGTRAHQLALYVIFESPLQMLCDAPSNYYREPLAMEFLSVVPTVWDETVPLFGKVGDYVGVARLSGEDWYIGVITDWTEREFEIDFSFLPSGNYTLTEFKDGYNADRHAEDCRKEVRPVDSSSRVKINLAPGGGYAAIVQKN
jgi:alpha-glucosidase